MNLPIREKELKDSLTLIDELQSGCNRCGLCSEACATFSVTGTETDSPRGRITLARAFIDGSISPRSAVLETFDRCLGCRACESVCPYGVRYEAMRKTVQDVRHSFADGPIYDSDCKIYSRNIDWAYRIGSVFWRSYGRRFLNNPPGFAPYKKSYLNEKGGVKISSGSPIVLVVGCLQDLFQQEAIESAIRVFRFLGHEIYTDRRQPCCGALFERLITGGNGVRYTKERNKAERYKSKRLRSFLAWQKQPVCFLSASCDCYMKEAAGFDQNAGIIDLYAFIAEKAKENQIIFSLKKPLTVYRQPYCRGSKKESDSVLSLLNSIEGLTVKEIENPLACCGGYCGESIWNPEASKKMFRLKTRFLNKGDIVVAESMDCALQFSRPDEIGVICLHPLQILALTSTYESDHNAVHSESRGF